MSLYGNIAAKKARIKAGSGEKMRKVGAKGAPAKGAFQAAALTAKKPKKGCCNKVMEPQAAAGVKHYFKNGTEYKGATHKDAKGKVMSGKTHTASSKYLFHKKDLPTSATKKA
jgi:hypothetical protein